MPRTALTGTRVREQRLLKGIRQADLARAVGISPAYLNLIEHNRRKAGAKIVADLARALEVDRASLAEGAEDTLITDLRSAAAAGASAAPPPELERIEEFAGRFPGWASLIAARQARIETLERAVEALNERMAQDPFLSASLHEVVSAVTSVRSTASILADGDEMEAEWRRKFHRNIHADSIRLSEAADALVAYLDASQEAETGLSSPQEEVEAWLSSASYHLAALEGTDPPRAELLIAGVPELASGAARVLALAHIARYREAAEALPLGPFREAVARLGPDPGRLADAFGQTLPTVFWRLASLPEESGAPVGLVICDASGTLTFRRPVPGFALPRFGAACPLWPLYEALARPMVPIRAEVEMAGRVPQRFFVHAYSQPGYPGGYNAPQVTEAMMLILPAPAPGPRPEARRPVGPSCRICPRAACVARREPSILVPQAEG